MHIHMPRPRPAPGLGPAGGGRQQQEAGPDTHDRRRCPRPVVVVGFSRGKLQSVTRPCACEYVWARPSRASGLAGRRRDDRSNAVGVASCPCFQTPPAGLHALGARRRASEGLQMYESQSNLHARPAAPLCVGGVGPGSSEETRAGWGDDRRLTAVGGGAARRRRRRSVENARERAAAGRGTGFDTLHPSLQPKRRLNRGTLGRRAANCGKLQRHLNQEGARLEQTARMTVSGASPNLSGEGRMRPIQKGWWLSADEDESQSSDSTD